jgi:hypothetical protein
LWFAPRLAAAWVWLFAFSWYTRPRSWRGFFWCGLVFSTLAAFSGLVGQTSVHDEESFLTISSPLVFFLLGVTMAGMTLGGVALPPQGQRPLAHWLGIGVAFVPSVVLAVGRLCGFPVPDPLYYRSLG